MNYILAYSYEREEFKIFESEDWYADGEDCEWQFITDSDCWEELNLLSKEYVGLAVLGHDLKMLFGVKD